MEWISENWPWFGAALCVLLGYMIGWWVADQRALEERISLLKESILWANRATAHAILSTDWARKHVFHRVDHEDWYTSTWVGRADSMAREHTTEQLGQMLLDRSWNYRHD